MEKMKLKPCPFCGGKAEIQLTDEDGKWKEKAYLDNPYNGVAYTIIHSPYPGTGYCPIGASGINTGPWKYVSEEGAAQAWNKRVGEKEQCGGTRLIDAEAINFEEVFGGQSDFMKAIREAAQKLIDKQPTAFDREKVIEELKETIDDEAGNRAIEIIERGGKRHIPMSGIKEFTVK